eukprot:5434224-Prymnesium_polylepis.2
MGGRRRSRRDAFAATHPAATGHRVPACRCRRDWCQSNNGPERGPCGGPERRVARRGACVEAAHRQLLAKHDGGLVGPAARDVPHRVAAAAQHERRQRVREHVAHAIAMAAHRQVEAAEPVAAQRVRTALENEGRRPVGLQRARVGVRGERGEARWKRRARREGTEAREAACGVAAARRRDDALQPLGHLQHILHGATRASGREEVQRGPSAGRRAPPSLWT